MHRSGHSAPRTFTPLQAAQETPTLARLCELAGESSARLKCIQALIPASLRKSVHPGPIDGANWCLLLDNSAVAAKIRQLVPSLQAHLRSKGFEVNAIRIKVRASTNGY